MEDPNLILTLEAINERAAMVLSHPHNKNRYVPPWDDHNYSYNSRECTPSVHPGAEEQSERSSKLQLKFDLPPKDAQPGFIFGSNPAVNDVILGGRRHGISGRHFNITFDTQRRLVLKATSKASMAVSYGGQGATQARTNFTWILFQGLDIVVIVQDNLCFRVVPATHYNCEAEYHQRVDLYLKESRNALGPIGLLNIQSQETTAAPTQPHSPRELPIYYDDGRIGEGSFGRVSRVFDVSTGMVYASKEFVTGRWNREVETMRDIFHEHIVQFISFTNEVKPCLIMEYLPLGSLESQHAITPITAQENMTMLQQGLLALEYLHSNGVAHRDIKPANILLLSRGPFHLKLADFGLAKEASLLETECGTRLYAAPEIWEGYGYSKAVDIWALGVVTFEYAYGLPTYEEEIFYPRVWYELILRALFDWNSGLKEYLTSFMLKMKPRERSTARECLEKLDPEDFLECFRDHDVEVETPTELMPSLAIMEACRILGRQRSLGRMSEAQTQVLLSGSRAKGSNHSPLGRQLSIPPGIFPGIETQNSETIKQRPRNTAAMKEFQFINHQADIEVSTSNHAGENMARRGAPLGVPGPALTRDLDHAPFRKVSDTKKLREITPGIVQMSVNGKPVSMRKADFWLDATQILALSGKNATDCKNILEVFRHSSAAEMEEPGEADPYARHWVSPRIGKILCDLFKLTEALRPVLPLLQFKHPSRAADNQEVCRNEMMPDFIAVICREALVAIRKSDFLVNGTHILKTAGIHRNARSLIQRLKMPYDSVRSGPRIYVGTYVGMTDGLNLCTQHGLTELHFHLAEIWRTVGFQECAKEETVAMGQTASLASPRVHRSMSAAGTGDPKTETQAFNVSRAVTIAPNSVSVETRPNATLNSVSDNDVAKRASRSPAVFTEPSYSKGSFLLPFEGPVLEKLNATISPSTPQVMSPYYDSEGILQWPSP